MERRRGDPPWFHHTTASRARLVMAFGLHLKKDWNVDNLHNTISITFYTNRRGCAGVGGGVGGRGVADARTSLGYWDIRMAGY